jgi:hypothetical protein
MTLADLFQIAGLMLAALGLALFSPALALIAVGLVCFVAGGKSAARPGDRR